ncbi:hypothetical protein [Sphingopyxis sp. PET50]|uniref:hypothetical protein n=1 Tax=Sphingopyxis sp. PET50 TaxID=2976533 RepID=UPI0021AE4473|nr:hypothetical protein [Sphingopyxis sp. PET50]
MPRRSISPVATSGSARPVSTSRNCARRMPKQPIEHGARQRVAQPVDIVEDQQQRTVIGVDPPGQRRRGLFGGRRMSGILDRRATGRPDGPDYPARGGGPVVLGIERQPAGRPAPGPCPPEQRRAPGRLPITG